MVRLCYYTDCDDTVRTKVLQWVHTEEFQTRIGMHPGKLAHEPGADTGRGRVHNWVIFADEQPVGLTSAQIKDQPPHDLFDEEPEDPGDYPLLGTVTYIDPERRGERYASAAKRAISEHDVAVGVRSFGCVIAADNPDSLKAIQRAGYEQVRIEKVNGKADRLHFRLRR